MFYTACLLNRAIYVQDTLRKRQLLGSSVEYFNGNSRVKKEVVVFHSVSYTDLCTGHSAKELVDNFLGRVT